MSSREEGRGATVRLAGAPELRRAGQSLRHGRWRRGRRQVWAWVQDYAADRGGGMAGYVVFAVLAVALF